MLVLFFASMLITSALTPLMRIIAIKLNVVDAPTQHHKTHKVPVPYLGGLAIVMGCVSVTYLSLSVSDLSEKTSVLVTAVFAPALMLTCVGLLDDMRELKPLPRFLFQSFIGTISAIVLITSDTIGSPTGIFLVDFGLSVIWIVGLMNSINFFDNIDGGASGSTAIICIALTIMAFSNGQFLIAAMSIVLSGATFGFLFWNKPPARIYMGDAGSLFLGTMLGALTIRLDSNSNIPLQGIIVILVLLSVPILDTAVVVSDRIRHHMSPFKGGRDHLSHRLMDVGFSRKKTILLLWTFCSIQAFFAVLSHLSINIISTISNVTALSLIIIAYFYFMRISVR